MPDQPADIFKLKPTERNCTRCADGRLYVEPISDLKAKHYCDGCDWFEIYSIQPAPMNVIPPQPLPETTMPRTKSGLEGNDYTRWLNAGKPDVEAFKAAGCPTPKKWAAMQEPAPSTSADPPASPPATRTKRKKRKAKAASKPKQTPAIDQHTPPVERPTSPPQQNTPASGNARIRLVVVEYQGDVGSVVNQLADLIRGGA